MTWTLFSLAASRSGESQILHTRKQRLSHSSALVRTRLLDIHLSIHLGGSTALAAEEGNVIIGMILSSCIRGAKKKFHPNCVKPTYTTGCCNAFGRPPEGSRGTGKKDVYLTGLSSTNLLVLKVPQDLLLFLEDKL